MRKCRACGESDFRCLDFHHRRPSRKSFSIARGITNGISKERIIAEVRKCMVLCANCHRKRHYVKRYRHSKKHG